ncbi:MAG: hypothetical protein ACREQC_05365, partial [Candidatus Binataceae bacterium]
MAAAIDTSKLEPDFVNVDRQAQWAFSPGGLKYWLWMLFCAFLTALGGAFWMHQVYYTFDSTGYGQPTMWAVYITNFVFWVGIA